ncbi:MAG: TPR end-of-group domain-containing protein, partial [Sarcina sp.]
YRMFQRALEIDRDNYMALYNMGVIYKKLNIIDKSKGMYIKSIKKNPGHDGSFLNLAVIQKEEGELEQGINTLTQGILYNPTSEFLYYNRACFYALNNQIDEATDDIIKAYEMHKTFLKYIMKDDDLEKVRETSRFKELLEQIEKK